MGMRIRRRPEEAIRDVRSSSKTANAAAEQRRDGIKKHATLVGDKSVLGETAGINHPTDDQLEVINRFTRSEKSAEELVAFDTMSCNDLVDRDDDFFKTSCVKAFATLPEPYSPVGKSFMVSHDHTSLPVGRIFGADTQKAEVDSKTAQFLTNSVFMPNTEQHQDFIENMDFGIYWAVSVGVVLNDASCVVGKEHPWGPWPWWCSEGHEKGFFYDPNSDEEDSWGWPMPVEDTAKGAVPCVRAFDDPRDFFELSMCFLGAQYFAELAKDPASAGMVKMASAFSENSRHLFNVGVDLAKELPILHAPDRVVEGIKAKTKVDFDGDGNLVWVENGMVWQYDHTSNDLDAIMCLGESKDADEVEKPSDESLKDSDADKGGPHGAFDGTHTHEHAAMGDQGDDETHTHSHSHSGDATHDHEHDSAKTPQERYDRLRSMLDGLQERIAARKADGEGAGDDEDEDPVDLAQSLDATLDAIRDALDEEDVAQASDLLTSAESTIDDLVELLGGVDADETDDPNKTAEGDVEMDKKAVVAAVKSAGLPAAFYEMLASVEEGNGLSDVLTLAAERLTAAEAELQTLKPKAELGEKYADDLRAEVRKSYVRAYQKGGEGEKINTKVVDRLIKLAGDDVDLLKELKEQYEDTVRQRFQRPETVESAVQDDPNAEDEGHQHKDESPLPQTLHSRVRIPGEK